MESTERVKLRIAAAFAANELEPSVVEGIAFHMTDWKGDLDDLVELYNRVEDMSGEQIRMIIMRFLVHVPNHVVAAKKLMGLGPTKDVFGVGVLEED